MRAYPVTIDEGFASSYGSEASCGDIDYGNRDGLRELASAFRLSSSVAGLPWLSFEPGDVGLTMIEVRCVETDRVCFSVDIDRSAVIVEGPKSILVLIGENVDDLAVAADPGEDLHLDYYKGTVFVQPMSIPAFIDLSDDDGSRREEAGGSL